MPKKFKLTDKQLEANSILANAPRDELFHLLLEGGSRSAKTFFNVRTIILRALKAPYSRHVSFRKSFKACKESIALETYPEVLRKAFPGVVAPVNKGDWYATFPNGSEYWFGGLDDKDRLEKILGKEYATGHLSECSQISNQAQEMVKTRIAQNVIQIINGQEAGNLPIRMLYDQNPPSKGHWCWKKFHLGLDPETKRGLPDGHLYKYLKVNPIDNLDNLPAAYIKSLDNMTPRMRKRFFLGEYSDENPNQLFPGTIIDDNRFSGEVPELIRVVVGIDPSGAADDDNQTNDAIGIVVVGLGIDGIAYVLEDCTVKAGPATWGRIATEAYDRHEADVVVGETNFGGEMVNYVIQTSRPNTPYHGVRASRGKVVRAEPFSALYEQGKVRHVGVFADLESELEGFSTHGYTGVGSPNRADALIWCLAELFPKLTERHRTNEHDFEPEPGYMGPDAWMA